MSRYIDGFLLPLQRINLAAYKKLARKAGRIWREHGATEYHECVLDDATAPHMIPFPRLAKAKGDEIVVFSWAVFKSRRQRDAANRKIMADPRIAWLCAQSEDVFDGRRMAYGGFKSIVEL
jgi:uncharacterized protein YbaA (DUF1428 family)